MRLEKIQIFGNEDPLVAISNPTDFRVAGAVGIRQIQGVNGIMTVRV